MVRFLSVACLGAFVGLAGGTAGQDAKELATLDGTWLLVAATYDGKVLDAKVCKDLAEIIQGGKSVTMFKGKEAATSTYTLVNPGKKPAQIDESIESGPQKGKMIKGIYKIEGDRMVTCFGLPGKDRPTEFESNVGSGTVLQTYEKQKADK